MPHHRLNGKSHTETLRKFRRGRRRNYANGKKKLDLPSFFSPLFSKVSLERRYHVIFKITVIAPIARVIYRSAGQIRKTVIDTRIDLPWKARIDLPQKRNAIHCERFPRELLRSFLPSPPSIEIPTRYCDRSWSVDLWPVLQIMGTTSLERRPSWR